MLIDTFATIATVLSVGVLCVMSSSSLLADFVADQPTSTEQVPS